MNYLSKFFNSIKIHFEALVYKIRKQSLHYQDEAESAREYLTRHTAILDNHISHIERLVARKGEFNIPALVEYEREKTEKNPYTNPNFLEGVVEGARRVAESVNAKLPFYSRHASQELEDFLEAQTFFFSQVETLRSTEEVEE